MICLKSKVATSAGHLAAASKGEPMTTTAVIMMFYILVTIFTTNIERVFWGESFPHLFDPFVSGAFIAYAAYAVRACAVYNRAVLASKS